MSTPLRLLVFLPSWVGDVTMATPTLRLLRRALPGAFIGALARPGIDQLLAGSDFFDEVHVERAQGMMGPKLVANKVRPRRYDAAILFPNSLSSALIVRLAGIPRRIGYDRDSRGLLLTQRIPAPRRDGRWAIVPAVDYYHSLASRALLAPDAPGDPGLDDRIIPLPAGCFMELATTPDGEQQADRILAAAGIVPGAPFAILNPGGNDSAKRWPAERFAAVGRHLAASHNLAILINGSPGEASICDDIALRVREASPMAPIASLTALGVNLHSLKSLIRRARLMVTNDTGPRHVAAAMGVPVVSLFGPTDYRWTVIPTRPGAPELPIIADPTLGPGVTANDQPERCRIDRIEVRAVIDAVDGALAATPSAL